MEALLRGSTDTFHGLVERAHHAYPALDLEGGPGLSSTAPLHGLRQKQLVELDLRSVELPGGGDLDPPTPNYEGSPGVL